MKSYLDTLAHILQQGDNRGDRTGVGTRGVFGVQTRYNLQEGFPAMTTKKLAWKAVVSELLWMLEGSGSERRLCEIRHGTDDADKKTIWTANAEAGYWKHKAKFPGDLGRVYGVQWRHWRSFNELSHAEDGLIVGNYTETDQIANLVDGLKNDPFGRRHLLTAWNPGELDEMALPPCHLLAQFNVGNLSDKDIHKIYYDHRASLPMDERLENDKLVGAVEGRLKTVADLRTLGLPTLKLDCQMYQRSCDMFLGVPFNIASYSLLTHMMAQVCGLAVGDFIHTLGDAHIYNNHFDAVEEQLTREPFEMPKLRMNPLVKDIDGFAMEDLELIDYVHYKTINAPMAV